MSERNRRAENRETTVIERTNKVDLRLELVGNDVAVYNLNEHTDESLRTIHDTKTIEGMYDLVTEDS